VLLLVPDSEFPLCLFVRLRIIVQLLDGVIVQYFLRKLYIPLRVFMSWIHFRIIWKSSKNLVERLVHLFCVAFEEATASADEHGVTRKHGLFGAILKEEAYAILGMARGVQRGDFDGAEVETGVVRRGSSHLVAVLAANYGEREVLEDLDISAGVVVVAGFV
jgi:hypothetical protein